MNVCSLQFQLDAETLSESLERLRSTLDPKSLSVKSNPEVLLALEVQVVSDVMVVMQQKYRKMTQSFLGLAIFLIHDYRFYVCRFLKPAVDNYTIYYYR